MKRNEGYQLIVKPGEMGIGNTTTSAACAAVLFGKDPADVTGRGAGLSSEGLNRKINVIRSAIAVNKPDPKDAIDVIAKWVDLILQEWLAVIWERQSVRCRS